MYSRNFILSVMFCISLSSFLDASTIGVPADQPTIQAGIDEAVDGDTVMVSDGTYSGEGNRDIDFKGKSIVVMSENGWEYCTINAEYEKRCFYFHNGEGSYSVLQGFSITHGDAAYGGGILCVSSSPTIRNNRIHANYVQMGGGGITCYNSSPYIVENLIEGNFAMGEYVVAGGIYCYGSSPTIADNVIVGNEVQCNEDWETANGGGIVCENNSSPLITGNIIAENNAFCASHSWTHGGGILNNNSSPVIINNTIVYNSSEEGPGIYTTGAESLYVSNSIVRDNVAWMEGMDQIKVWGTPCLVKYSNVELGFEGEGNIDADAVMVDPANGNYELTPDSPCIDSGDPGTRVPPLGGDRVDIGALEYQFPENTPLTLTFENTPSYGNPGGVIEWEYAVENPGDTSVVFDGWLALSGPINSIKDSILGVTIPPLTTRDGKLRMYIPPGAPLGLYTLKGYLGIIHEEIWDGEVFTTEIIDPE